MAVSYAARNAAAKAQGFKSLYDMRKAAMASKAAQTVAQGATEALPQAGQLALPAAGQTSLPANPGLLQDVLNRMRVPGNFSAEGPTQGAIPGAASYPQLESIAARSASAANPGTSLTLMNQAEHAAAASARVPGQGTIMGALNPGTSPPLALTAGPEAYGPGAISGGAGFGNLRSVAASGAGAAGGEVLGEVAGAAAKAPWYSWGAGAGEAGAGRLLAVGGLGGAMTAGGLAMGGLTAGGLIDSANVGGENSNWDRGLSGAARGAGVGAAAGSVIPVLGTAVGAIGGGAAGALINIFGKKGKNKGDQFDSELQKQTATLQQIANAYGLDAATQSDLMKSFMTDAQVAKITGGKTPDKSLLAQQVASYASQIPAVVQQKKQLAQSGYDGLAMGRAIQDYINPIMAKSAQTQQVSADYYQGLADKYASSPGVGSGYGAMAQNARNYSTTSNADWAKAMSLQPTVAALAAAQKQAAVPTLSFQSVYAPQPVA